jgi:hypothetical protein
LLGGHESQTIGFRNHGTGIDVGVNVDDHGNSKGTEGLKANSNGR